MKGALPFLPLVALLGCNQYVMLRVTGFEQENYNNDADILFVVDNSDSMQPVAEGLALAFNDFINTLTSSEGANASRETLGDAVSNYIRETSGDTLLLDYQLAITTTSVAGTGSVPGDGATLVGPVIPRTSGTVASDFSKQLLCQATCWSQNEVPSDPDFVCTENPDPGDAVSREYLDCVCGSNAWTGHCGSGDEMGIEAAALGLCRGLADPPDSCFEYVDPQDSSGDTMKPTQFTDADVLSSEGLLREGATTVVVIVTDEGDNSYRMTTGDSDIEPYVDFFESLPNPVRMAVIGPYYHDGDMGCNSGGAQPWATKRYQELAGEFNGVYVDIEDDSSGVCDYTDFSQNLISIGDLVANLLTIFPLQQVPDVSTIRVFVDYEPVLESQLLSGSEEEGNAEYGDGWSYDPTENAVSFHGEAVPDFNQDVRIYYRPLGGMPRTLPDVF